jgi:hypothetical protein
MYPSGESKSFLQETRPFPDSFPGRSVEKGLVQVLDGFGTKTSRTVDYIDAQVIQLCCLG